MSQPYHREMRPINEAKSPTTTVAAKTPNKLTGKTSLELLKETLAVLYAMRVNYQVNHWTISGQNFYELHLLFQRLYESVDKEIDTLGEKIIAYYGNDAIKPSELMDKMKKWSESWTSDHITCCVNSEKDLQAAIKYTYDQMKKNKGELTLGMDDFLMATANAHETNLYLLTRIKNG